MVTEPHFSKHLDPNHRSNSYSCDYHYYHYNCSSCCCCGSSSSSPYSCC